MLGVFGFGHFPPKTHMHANAPMQFLPTFLFQFDSHSFHRHGAAGCCRHPEDARHQRADVASLTGCGYRRWLVVLTPPTDNFAFIL